MACSKEEHQGMGSKVRVVLEGLLAHTASKAVMAGKQGGEAQQAAPTDTDRTKVCIVAAVKACYT